MLRRYAFYAALGALWASPALADVADSGCKLQLESVPSQWKIQGVDLFETPTAFGSFDVQLVNQGTSPCSINLVFDTQGEPFGLSSGGGRRIGYSIFDNETGADLTPKNGRTPPYRKRAIVVGPHTNKIVRFNVAVPNTFDSDGAFLQQLRIEGDDSAGSDSVQRNVSLLVDVASSASMGLSGQFTRNGSVAEIDLGEIEANMVRTPVVLHVRSSRAYRIESRSENGGKLKLHGTSWEIPYHMIIAGQSLDTNGGVYLSTPGVNRRVDNVALGFAITGGTNVEAGRYADIITLAISVI